MAKSQLVNLPKSESSKQNRTRHLENKSSSVLPSILQISPHFIAETPYKPSFDHHLASLTATSSAVQRNHMVLQLQRTYGNQYVQRLLASVRPMDKPGLQPISNDSKSVVNKNSKPVSGGSKPSTQNSKLPDDKIKTESEDAFNPKDVVDALGDLYGSATDANEPVYEQAANVIIMQDRGLAWLLINHKTDEHKELKESIEKYVPWIITKTATGAFSGYVGGGLGMVSGLVGMAQGISKAFSSTGEMDEKLDGLFTTQSSFVGMVAGGTGLVGTTTGIAVAATKGTKAGDVLEIVSGVFKPLGDGLKTIKSVIETGQVVLKNFFGLINRAKKGVKTTVTDVLGGLSEFGMSVAGTLKNAFNTASGVLTWIKALPGFDVALGIVGSVMDIVSGVCEFIKNVIEAVKVTQEKKENQDKIKQLEDNDQYKFTERNLLRKLIRMAGKKFQNLKFNKNKKPEVGQIQDALQQYEQAPNKGKDKNLEKDYQDVKGYLLDRNLEEILVKRINRSYSKIPEFVMALIANGVSILGGVVSVAADITALIAAPTGIISAIALAAKTIASVASGITAGIFKLGKAIYSLARSGIRQIKQWWGGKDKAQAKQEARIRQTKTLMGMVAELKNANPSNEESAAEIERINLRLEAAGVTLKELFALNGKPLDQAQTIYKALAKRE